MARSKHDEALGQAVETIAINLWRYRIELACLLIVPATVFLPLPDSIVVAFILILLARPTKERIHAARVRRQWARACTETGTNARVRKVQPVVAGDRLQIRVGPRDTIRALEKASHHLAERLKVREVRVARDPDNAQRAEVLVLRRDPFAGADPIPWPAIHTETVSGWDSIPAAIDEQGDRRNLNLVERNILVAGEPGGGKSVFLSMLAAWAAKAPDTKLWILDGKRVELAAWAPCAERLVGPDGTEATAALKTLRTVMDERYRELLARGHRKISRDSGLPLHLVIIDELAFYLQLPDTKQRALFTDLLRDLVARGRAAGVIVAAATQKSGTDLVPSSLRDLFAFRLAFRATTPEMSDVILGRGWASAGADSSSIPIGQRGVGYLLAEGERPVRIKTYYLSDEDIAGISSRAAGRSIDLEALYDLPAAAGSINLSALETAPQSTGERLQAPVDGCESPAASSRTQTFTHDPQAVLDLLAAHPEGIKREQFREHRISFKKAVEPLIASGDVEKVLGPRTPGSGRPPFLYRLPTPEHSQGGSPGND